MAVKMELARILIREDSQLHVVELREVEGHRVMPIVIGINEAAAIERRVMGQQPLRPQTHELLDSVIKHLGAQVERIVINDLRHDAGGHGTFYARLILRRGEQTVDVDSRPSDAIALGCVAEVPIFVEEHVLEAVVAAEGAEDPDLDFPDAADLAESDD